MQYCRNDIEYSSVVHQQEILQYLEKPMLAAADMTQPARITTFGLVLNYK
jgi:hypothetical protein